MAHSGFVIIPREDFDRIWQQLVPTHKTVFLQCIIRANYRDREWWDGKEYVTIKRGQFVTSLRTLALCCGRDINKAKARAALNNLKRMGEIHTEDRGGYTLVTLVNYERYASLSLYINTPDNTPINTPDDKAVTAEHPDGNTPVTTRESIKALKHKGNNENLYRWVRELVRRWNGEIASHYPEVSPVKLKSGNPPLGNARMRHLQQRFDEQDFVANLDRIFEKVRGSPGLTTRTKDWPWVVSFDFLIANDGNYMKILEGKYEQHSEPDPYAELEY
ncbi:hypothetical protein ACFL2Z_00885 [Candidatus Eisenbacteria bacterium]|uniref:Uncharacterized protein n=1 Tax=Eiseniibacteriota bacterium TaxID=2212470 RepID=A0ABV6YN03_UNCEI